MLNGKDSKLVMRTKVEEDKADTHGNIGRVKETNEGEADRQTEA